MERRHTLREHLARFGTNVAEANLKRHINGRRSAEDARLHHQGSRAAQWNSAPYYWSDRPKRLSTAQYLTHVRESTRIIVEEQYRENGSVIFDNRTKELIDRDISDRVEKIISRDAREGGKTILKRGAAILAAGIIAAGLAVISTKATAPTPEPRPTISSTIHPTQGTNK